MGKINKATPKASLSGAEEIPVNDAGNDRKITVSGIVSYIFGKLNKTTLADADKFAVNGTNTTTWGNIKNYFLSSDSPAASVIDSGAGDKILFNDGTYKDVPDTGIGEAPTGNQLPYVRVDGEWFDSANYVLHIINGNAQVVNIDMRDQMQFVVRIQNPATSLAAFTTNVLAGRYFSKDVIIDNQTAAPIPATNLNADYYESGLSSTHSFPVGVTRIYYKYMDGKLFAGLGNVVSSGGGGASTYTELTDTPATKIAKKLQKVNDAGTALENTDYDHDQVVQKAATYNAGTLKKFDSDGNDEDSGLTGESLDIYAISVTLITDLTTGSNWIDGSGFPILGGVAFASGVKGQRYYSNDYFFECISDATWVRTLTGRPIVNIYDNLTLTQKGYLENTSNWGSKIYTGTAITGVAQGTRHYDNDYVYEFFQSNLPIRYSRV